MDFALSTINQIKQDSLDASLFFLFQGLCKIHFEIQKREKKI